MIYFIHKNNVLYFFNKTIKIYFFIKKIDQKKTLDEIKFIKQKIFTNVTF